MLVRNVMVEDVTCVSPDDTLQQAYDLIQTKRYDCLPVLSAGRRTMGIVQLTDIYEACLVNGKEAGMQKKVADAMVTSLVTIHPDQPVERAAQLLLQRDVPMLPVVEDGELVGVINEDDIFRAFAEMLGAGSRTLRLTLVVPERKGQLARIAEIIRDAGITITHVATFQSNVLNQYSVIVRVEADASRPLIQRLEAHGYKVIHADAD